MTDNVFELERENERLRKALENAITGILVTDSNGTISFSNTHWAQMHGYTPEELINENVSIFHTPEIMSTVTLPLLEKTKTKEYGMGECESIKKDGTKFTLYVRVTPTKNSQGEFTGFAWSGMDITDQKRRLLELQERAEELERLNSAMVDRELKMIEMKATLDKLRSELEELKRLDVKTST